MANNKKRKHSSNVRNVNKEVKEVQQTVNNSKPQDGRKMIIRIGMLALALIMALGAVLPLFF